MKIDPATEKKIVRMLAEQYKVKLAFIADREFRGSFIAPNLVQLSEDAHNDVTSMIGTFFHELGHVHAYRNKIFKAYHRLPVSRKNRTVILATAVRAERWVDNWGRLECLKHFPQFKWTKTYASRGDIDVLKNFLRKVLV